MSEPADDGSKSEAKPLDYHTPVPDSRGHPGMVIVGVLAGGACWFAIAMGLASLFWQPMPGGSGKAAQYGAAAFMFAVAAAASGLVVKLRRRRFFWIGFLIGSAIMGLLQGLCFISL
jgi:hypothetical protein